MAWLRVNDPRGRTRTEALVGDRTVVGRSASCEIRIDDPDVALRHLSILRTDHGLLLVNETESLPVWDGDAAVTNHFMVQDVPYRIGSSTVTLVGDPAADRAPETGHEPGPAPNDLELAATMMGEAPQAPVAPADPPPAQAPPSDPPRVGRRTQQQGSGAVSDNGTDSTRTLRPGPPPPSETQTVPGVLEVLASGGTQPATHVPASETPRPPPVPAPDPAPPVRFPPPVPVAEPSDTPGSASDSWVWRKGVDAPSRSAASVYSMGQDADAVRGASESWDWNPPGAPIERQPAIDRPSRPHVSERPPARAAHPTPSRVQPVLLRPPSRQEPPLPIVSKQLSSGHSWMWALPSSVRDGADPGRSVFGGRGRPWVTAGVVLIILGAGLIATAFALGLTPEAIAQALEGNA